MVHLLERLALATTRRNGKSDLLRLVNRSSHNGYLSPVLQHFYFNILYRIHINKWEGRVNMDYITLQRFLPSLQFRPNFYCMVFTTIWLITQTSLKLLLFYFCLCLDSFFGSKNYARDQSFHLLFDSPQQWTSLQCATKTKFLWSKEYLGDNLPPSSLDERSISARRGTTLPP